jgi:NADPH:quinone reductase-like Zn-dependent oxidoreductase
MTTMRAILMNESGDADVLSCGTAELPLAVNSEFLVRVVAAGVNPIDAKTRAGRGVAPAIPSLPAILGFDFSGVVVSSPYEGHPIKVGDEVYGMTGFPRYGGSYADFVAVSSLSVARKPKALSHVEAAAVPLAALTAWGMVVEVAKAHEGQRILIHAGAGGVGHFAVQFARFFGAYVIATGSARNIGWLKELGANETVDYTSERFDEVIDTVDVVIDLIGNVHENTGSRSISVVRHGGLIVNAPTGSWPTFLEEAAAAGLRATTYKVAPDGVNLAVISRLLESGDVRVFVDQVFDMDKAADAHRSLETGHTRGKIVLKVSDY